MITKNSYLFAELTQHKILRSPLFYVGDKHKLIHTLKPYFPKHIRSFVEPFAGGGSVFLNVSAHNYFLNDIDYYVFKLHRFLTEQAHNPTHFFEQVEWAIAHYGLSHSYKSDIVPNQLKQAYKKTHYAHFNKPGFQRLKNDFNASDKSNMLHLYLLLIYGFNRMLRFNSSGNYNLPVGNVDFNKNVIDALFDYFEVVQNKAIHWFNLDYKAFLDQLSLSSDDFIYFDPPYLITFSEYNKLWNEEKEAELIDLLNELHQKKLKFAVSNVTLYKNRENKLFANWAKNFTTIPVKSNYISYHDNSIKHFKEVIVLNYDPQRL